MAGLRMDVKSSQDFFSAVAAAYGKTPNILYEHRYGLAG
jgi:hypothetical protein